MAKSERTLRRWGLLMVGDLGPILAGDEGGGSWRTSTPLVEFDPQALTALTASGRPYRLQGAPDAANALLRFHSLWNAEGRKVRVVSSEEAAVLVKGNSSFDFDAEERDRLSRLKMEHLSGQIWLQMVSQGLDKAAAAEALGLAPEKFEAILSCDTAGATGDEADDAFLAIVKLGSGPSR